MLTLSIVDRNKFANALASTGIDAVDNVVFSTKSYEKDSIDAVTLRILHKNPIKDFSKIVTAAGHFEVSTVLIDEESSEIRTVALVDSNKRVLAYASSEKPLFTLEPGILYKCLFHVYTNNYDTGVTMDFSKVIDCAKLKCLDTENVLLTYNPIEKKFLTLQNMQDKRVEYDPDAGVLTITNYGSAIMASFAYEPIAFGMNTVTSVAVQNPVSGDELFIRYERLN